VQPLRALAESWFLPGSAIAALLTPPFVAPSRIVWKFFLHRWLVVRRPPCGARLLIRRPLHFVMIRRPTDVLSDLGHSSRSTDYGSKLQAEMCLLSAPLSPRVTSALQAGRTALILK
jgi:hypothetical protein